MKTVIYKGSPYLVSDHAKWVAEDSNGQLWAYTKKPLYNDGDYISDPGTYTFIAQLEKDTLKEIL